MKPADWHRADIIAALHKRGLSLRRLSKIRSYHPGVLANALSRPYPKAERLIAQAIGQKPQAIWPSRYDASGVPLRNRKGRGQGRHVQPGAYSGQRGRRNVHRAGSI